MNSGNRGIIISGGNVNLGTVAVGDNARAQSTVTQGLSLEQLRQEIGRLIEVSAQARGTPSGEDAKTAAALQEEARKDRPDKSIMSTLLQRFGHGAEAFHSVTTALAAVKELVDLLPV
jgi:hypothetical protein